MRVSIWQIDSGSVKCIRQKPDASEIDIFCATKVKEKCGAEIFSTLKRWVGYVWHCDWCDTKKQKATIIVHNNWQLEIIYEHVYPWESIMYVNCELSQVEFEDVKNVPTHLLQNYLRELFNEKETSF